MIFPEPHIMAAHAPDFENSGIWYPQSKKVREVCGMSDNRNGCRSREVIHGCLVPLGSGDRYPRVRAHGTRCIRAYGTPLNR